MRNRFEFVLAVLAVLALGFTCGMTYRAMNPPMLYEEVDVSNFNLCLPDSVEAAGMERCSPLPEGTVMIIPDVDPTMERQPE